MSREPTHWCAMANDLRPHPRADLILAAARTCLGVRFRPQGRTTEGLDCLGLALFCCETLGLGVPPPPAIGMRGCAPEEARRQLLLRGFALRPTGRALAGDLLVASPGALQLHFAIFTGAGVIEADMGLRRVVERPWPWALPIFDAWCFPTGEI